MEWYLMAAEGGLLEALQGWGSTLWVIASVALTLGFVIFVHELGHFLAAKACGVKCEKFYLGFDVPMRLGPLQLPAALFRYRWGETEYGIGILPLGGYVKMLGQDDNPQAQTRENERIRIRKTGQAAGADQPQPVTAGSPSAGDGSAADRSATEMARASMTADSATSSDPSTPLDSNDEAFELDPRSFPAKPVWQRMIIISAGVVMNLIFAVIFAAVAYGMGVRYVPCVIGDSWADSPAWRAGLGPGDQILQIGRRYQPDEKLRFRGDLLPQVVLNGGEEPLELLVRRYGQSQADWISIRPANRYREVQRAIAENPPPDPRSPRAAAQAKALEMLPRTASLGVSSISTTVVNALMTNPTYQQVYPALAPLKAGDEIVAVDGRALPRPTADGESGGPALAASLEMHLARRMTEPVTLTVQRPAAVDDAGRETSPATRLDVTLPPRRMRMLGMAMRVGPVAAVRQGTPAQRAGLRAGDRLIALDDHPLGDPATLPQRLLAMVGREIEIQYQRDGATQTVRLTPAVPQSLGQTAIYGGMLALEPLGVAVPVENVVQSIDADGPARSAGLRPGDEIMSVQLVLQDPQRLAEAKELHPSYDKPMYLTSAVPTWNYVQTVVQRSLPGTQVQLTVLRAPEAGTETPSAAATPHVVTATIAPLESETWYCGSRGLILSSLSRVRTAEAWSEAWSLGLRETRESVTQVVRVLRGLITGRISWTNLGGPITIATAAGYEASEGFSQLLIFLTLLSANLAVLNFLPIPALDGGHMVFLAAEGIRGKPVDERLQVMLTVIGVVFLLGLIVILSIKDVGTLLEVFG